MAASALQAERCLFIGVGAGSRRHRLLLRMPPPLHAPPLLLLPHRRRGRCPPAVRVSPGEGGGGGGGGLAGAVEKPLVMGVVAEEEEEEERGAKVVEEEEGDVAAAAGALEMRWPPWEGLAERYKLIAATSLAFVICNMDKVNLSVAIIPMSHKYGWNSSTAGLVQSSFFWGYALSQLPGGWLAKLFGGRRVLEVGVVAWSLATAIIPAVAGFMPGLVLSRILVLEKVSIPVQERSRAVAVVFGGLSFGSVLGCLGFQSLKEQQLSGNEDMQVIQDLGQSPAGSSDLISSSVSPKSSESSLGELINSLKDVPWREFFKSKAVWAMIYAHFCGSWGHYTCLSWLPTFFSEELDLNLTEAAWVSVLPPLGSMIITSIAAPFADNLISNGVDTTKVRKICQTIAFLSPATFMMLSSVDLGVPPWEIVAFLTSGLALSSFALSGHVAKLPMNTPFSGITNTVGAVPGIVGVALTGYLLDTTHSWSISLFAPSIFFYLTGTAVWLAFASSEPQEFSKSESES
uniref:Major facilitator superfamily (MFS) profile domain-containing protein n=1 Tax=Oryza punctata TaxID=4537 RepID=A0A0E0M4E2_ORYPU